jgi:predicted nucleic acid-binding protein
LELAEKCAIKIVGSQMIVKELDDITDAFRLKVLQMVYQSLCSQEVRIDNKILDRAEQIRHISNIKYKDSIHLACAEASQVDVLLTTDKKFLNNCRRIETFTQVMNPNEWLMEVLY